MGEQAVTVDADADVFTNCAGACDVFSGLARNLNRAFQHDVFLATPGSRCLFRHRNPLRQLAAFWLPVAHFLGSGHVEVSSTRHRAV